MNNVSSPDPVSFSSLGNGLSSPPEKAQRLRAGQLGVDLIEGELRYFTIGAGRQEAVRRIYAAVRDSSWNTIASQRSVPEIVTTEDGGFTVSCQNVHQDGDIDFTWESRITGTSDGVIRWEFDGVARRAFAKNRIGFCVLHPLAVCQGKPCEVGHVSGDVAQRTFPDWIAPDQPVRGLHDYHRMRYSVSDAWDVEIAFEGDTFEMEDQRNWTDASFKTYSTPQRIPLPAQLREGQRVRQVVTVKAIASGAEDAAPAPADGGIELRPEPPFLQQAGTGDFLPFPKIGLGMPSHGGRHTATEVQRLRALRLDHLRVDVKVSQADWRETLAGAASEAAQLNCALELALHLTQPSDVQVVAEATGSLPAPLARVLVIEEGKPVAGPAFLQAARSAFPGQTGAGTDIDFFPLNNNRPSPELADFIFCSIRPQAHAFDDASIIENLDGQTHLVASARHLFAPLPFVASPVTLKRRWHKGPPRPAGELPPMVDRRQLSLLGAGWLTGSLQALTASGTASITWFETTGWRGIMETEAGAPLPHQFPSVPGAVFPMYHILRAVADFRDGGGLCPVHVSRPLQVQAALLESKSGQRWIISNVTGQEQRVSFAASGTLRLLDDSAAAGSAMDPEAFWSAGAPAAKAIQAGELVLPPWATAFIDVPGKPETPLPRARPEREGPSQDSQPGPHPPVSRDRRRPKRARLN